MVHGDDERLLQALGNLLGNALKFTPRGGLVNIVAERVGTDPAPAVRFAVRDTGPGIAPDDLPHIFDRFWQGRAGERRGAGLGLAIVRGIVEAHGGQVHVESIPGQGTTVAFSIPVLGGAEQRRE
jgi:signal transduction histidine kinase